MLDELIVDGHVHVNFNFDAIYRFIFSVINDSLAEFLVVILLSVYDYVYCFSGKRLHVFFTIIESLVFVISLFC